MTLGILKVLSEYCEYCEKSSPVYRWDQVCCRARFLMALPSKAMRAAWLEIWEARDGQVFAAEIRQAGLDLWNERRAKLSGTFDGNFQAGA